MIILVTAGGVGLAKAGPSFIQAHLVPLSTNAPKVFGFPEFLAGLALMVLAWSIADTRYRFRIQCAPIPLQSFTFATVAIIGTLTLLTDLWRAQGWLVIKSHFFTSAIWQTLLAMIYFVTFLTWAVFAFIKPATFGKWNAKRYAQTLFKVIVKGSTTEMAVVADELARSAKAIVFHATGSYGSPYAELNGEKSRAKLSETASYANNILSLIADKRFCRAVVESSPGTAWGFFFEMGEQKKYTISIKTFANNIVNEAVENRNSFLYHETAGYESGLIGDYKPLSRAIFANYKMVECVETLFDTDYRKVSEWGSDQWEAYLRAVLITFRDYVQEDHSQHSKVLERAFENVKSATSDLYKLDGLPNVDWNSDALGRLRAVVGFIRETVAILNRKPTLPSPRRRRKTVYPRLRHSIYEMVARTTYQAILDASAIKVPRDLCWTAQYVLLWSYLFGFGSMDGQSSEKVKSLACHLLYDEIAKMRKWPNFEGARILSFCLNVMGLELYGDGECSDTRALHRAIVHWTRRNYAWLHDNNPRIAEACLADGMTYDAANSRIVRTYPIEGPLTSPRYVYLPVDPPPTPHPIAPRSPSTSAPS